MSEDIDRRIAIEVMGEEEPPVSTEHFKAGIRVHSLVFRENWCVREIWDESGDFVAYGWQPYPFSSVLEEALRAVDKRLADWRKVYPHWPGKPMLFMEYHPEDPEDIYFGVAFGTEGDPVAGTWTYGQTLPEAICNLLLTLIEARLSHEIKEKE